VFARAGNAGKALNALRASGVASVTPEVRAALQDLHPDPISPIPMNVVPNVAALVVNESAVRAAVRSFPPHTASGLGPSSRTPLINAGVRSFQPLRKGSHCVR
jgi:hypothetical protein